MYNNVAKIQVHPLAGSDFWYSSLTQTTNPWFIQVQCTG